MKRLDAISSAYPKVSRLPHDIWLSNSHRSSFTWKVSRVKPPAHCLVKLHSRSFHNLLNCLC